MKTLFVTKEFTDDYSYYNEYVVCESCGKKFRIQVELRDNSQSLGFDYYKCLQVMTSNGEFANVADPTMIGFKEKYPKYKSSSAREEYTKKLVNAFKDFIEKVY